MRTLALTLALITALGAFSALADETGKPPAGPPDDSAPPPEAPAAAPGKEAAATSPFARILKELTALVAREKAKPQFDKALVSDLEEIVKTYSAMKDAKPVRLEDLPEADRKRLEDEVRRKVEAERGPVAGGGDPGAGGGPGGGPGGGGPGGDWLERERQRRVGKALEGVELTDEQRPEVETMVSEFLADAFVAYTNQDVGTVNDLKNDLEKRLKAKVGAKKAKDIINNLNRQMPGRGGFGR